MTVKALSQENLRTPHREYSEKILDETATKDYKKAIEELNELVQEAQENKDIEEAEEVQKKIAFVQGQLKNASGYKHNPRRFSNTAQERARKNISNNISRAIAMIEKEHKTLGSHFRKTIKTGYTCSYEPEKEILWII
jgi:superoxide dismutase